MSSAVAERMRRETLWFDVGDAESDVVPSVGEAPGVVQDAVVGGRPLDRAADRVTEDARAMPAQQPFEPLYRFVGYASSELAKNYKFSPAVSVGESGSVSIWLPELRVYGSGLTLEEAETDLVDAVLGYMDEWFTDLHRVPNHSDRWGWVVRLALAPSRGRLLKILVGEGT